MCRSFFSCALLLNTTRARARTPPDSKRGDRYRNGRRRGRHNLLFMLLLFNTTRTHSGFSSFQFKHNGQRARDFPDQLLLFNTTRTTAPPGPQAREPHGCLCRGARSQHWKPDAA